MKAEDVTQLTETITTARTAIIDSGEMLNYAMSNMSTSELMKWAIANGASEHDSRRLADAAHDFLKSSATSLRSASEVLELLGKIMKTIEDEQKKKEDNDE